MLATSFGLTRQAIIRPNIYKTLKNAGSYDIIRQFHGIPFTFEIMK